MKAVFISDTHNKHNKIKVPECDILFHSGDWSFQGLKTEVEDFAKWLNKQKATHIVVIPGNHELYFERHLEGDDPSREWFSKHCPRSHLLIDQSVEIEGLKIYGSPWTPYFNDWAFNAGRDIIEAAHILKPFIGDIWKNIPDDTNILLTHGPAIGILDLVLDFGSGKIQNVGCMELLKRIQELKQLKIHAFGHLHFNGGQTEEVDGVKHINASVCDDMYVPHSHRQIIVEI